MDAQCVNIGFHHHAQCVVDHAVARQRHFARESFGHDRHVEMAAPILGTGMTCVQMTLVLYQQMLGRECLNEKRFDPGDPIGAHGRTLLNGFTITSLYTPARA